MGSQFIQCGYCTREEGPFCKRPCNFQEIEAEQLSCDPAGCFFGDTIRHLGELEQAAFQFASSSNLSALRWLFVFGAAADVSDSNGTTLLHVACRTGSLPVVKDLVRRGLTLNCSDSAGWTPLHVASCMGRHDVSLYLLRSGAKPHIKNNQGQMPEDLCSNPWTKEVVLGFDADRSLPSNLGFPGRSGLPIDSVGASAESGLDCFSSLHFEPFFVPRDPVYREPLRSREEDQQLSLDIFGQSPGHSIAFLVAAGVVRDNPIEIIGFLARIGANPTQFGEYLGEDFPISQTLRLAFLNSLPLLGTGVISALQAALREIAMPHDLVKVDRLVRGIAHFWWRSHKEALQARSSEGEPIPVSPAGAAGELAGINLQRCLLGTDALHRLMFSTLMLFRWLREGHRMSLNHWMQLNTGIEGSGSDIPIHVQTGIHAAIVDRGVKLEDHEDAEHSSVRSPTIQSWGFVHYSGRAQVSHLGEMAELSTVSPRALAAQGGVWAAGMSSTMPGFPDPELPPFGEEDIQCFSSVCHVRRAHPCGRPVGAVSALVQPKSERAEVSDAFDDGEAAWLSLHRCLLFFAHTNEAPPYAFVSLRQASIREVDTVGRRIVLARKQDPSRGTEAEEAGWLQLCLLLGDGRFQPLEAPFLELRWTGSTDFDMWSAQLGELCFDHSHLHAPALKAAAEMVSSYLDNGGWPDNSAIRQTPDRPTELCTDISPKHLQL